MADGRGGSTPWSEPGYVEPPRDSDGADHSNTDYAQAVKETRHQAFLDGRSRR